MTGSHRVVLLACGSFNPPTNMHLRMFEIARDFLHRTTNYNVVAGLMSPVNDKYGKEGLVSGSDRIQMLRLALNSSSWVHVSEWESNQDEWTPTREVVQYHQNLIQTAIRNTGSSSASSGAAPQGREIIDSVVNGSSDPTVKRHRGEGSMPWLTHLATQSDTVSVKLLCGADLLESFAKPGLWKDEDIEALVGKFGLVVITREGSNPYKFIYESDVLTRHQRNIQVVTEWITNEISSTKVRRALRRGDSVKYLVQDTVIDYIYKNALFDTHNNSKYFYSPFMLTPSPNLDTDVLLPPPSFTLHQASHHVRPRGTLLATRHHPIRKSSIFSDMDDTSPGDSIDDAPLVQTHTVKSYPGVAIPVVQRSLLEVGSDASDRTLTERTLTKRVELLDGKRITDDYEKPPRLTSNKYLIEAYATKEKSKSAEGPQMNSSHSLDELELSSGLTVDYLQEKMQAASAPPSRGASPCIPKPSLVKSLSTSKREVPPKSDPIPIPRKVFTSHNRSKSSGALKPEKTFDVSPKSARDDISLLQRDTNLLSIGSSNIYELLSKKTHISPSHTEKCLAYIPKKAELPSSWERSRSNRHGEHLYTSRSLERPSTPKHNKHLSSIHKHSSLPLQQSRDRSPSPVRTQNHWRLERQYAQFARDNTCDIKDAELGKLRRTLTHEEEINLIISGDSKFLTKLKSPESFTPPEIPDGDGLLMPEKQYEMKF